MLCLPHEIKHLDKIEELVKQSIPRLEFELQKAPKIINKERLKNTAKKDENKTNQKQPENKILKNTEPKNIDISKPEATSLTKDAQKDTKNPVKGLGEHVPAFLLR